MALSAVPSFISDLVRGTTLPTDLWHYAAVTRKTIPIYFNEPGDQTNAQ